MEKVMMNAVEKALQINLDSEIYGTIAEIGAGQEVARNFFIAGGASGTIAKTMSAYDMKISDTIYGPEKDGRYVSKSRAHKIIDREYDLLIERLEECKPETTKFFSFGDTIAAKSFKSKKECHGWMGIKFQHAKKSGSSTILLHVRMKDNTANEQQAAIGKLGVNLIYGAFYYFNDPQKLIKSLLDNLSSSRIEVDMIKFEGDAFTNIDNRLLSLELIKVGLTRSIIFTPDGEMAQPSDLMHKKNILLFRGTFRPVTNVHVDIINNGYNQVMNEPDIDESKLVKLVEISMASILNTDNMNTEDFLGRVDTLCKLGYNVQITNFLRYFRLKEYLTQFTNQRIYILMGARKIQEIFLPDYYTDLHGGILEAMGILFTYNTKLLVYPKMNKEGDMVDLNNLEIIDDMKFLKEHLVYNKSIVPFDEYNKEMVSSNSKLVQQQLNEGNPAWKTKVPEIIVDEIVNRKLFGCKEC